ncbi:hypothetical protein RRG08_004232 [Elysia crispata]|uniref:Uncharacterized protein n=1 Tax=Elysia crispata TaxID=231223 RepID=A0AAE1DH99_9GAST|nr:hypothetical protein RRG08_004232 [Elysia crispata]
MAEYSWVPGGNCQAVGLARGEGSLSFTLPPTYPLPFLSPNKECLANQAEPPLARLRRSAPPDRGMTGAETGEDRGRNLGKVGIRSSIGRGIDDDVDSTKCQAPLSLWD